MMDLTPLDVRKKKGDFRRGIRGYEQAQVDDFLDLVADRMEALVRSASSVDERIARLEQQVADYRDREKALTEALVSAQQMREDIRTQSTREVEMLRKQAEQDAERIRADAIQMREREEQSLEGLRSRQFQFLASYQKYLEQELSELTAMVHGLEMHGGRTPRPGQSGWTESGSGRAGASPQSSSTVPAASPDQAGAATRNGPVAFRPTTEQAAEPVPPVPERAWPEPAEERKASEPPSQQPASPSGQAPVGSAAIVVETVPEPAEASATAAVEQKAPVEQDAPLEEALARWEPELSSARPAVVLDAEDETGAGDEQDDLILSAEADEDSGLDEADDEVPSAEAGAFGLDEADEEFVLSADDVVTDAAVEAATADAAESEDDVDLAFLEFGDDDVVASEDPAVMAANAEQVDRDVTAAMVDADGDFIDMGRAFDDDPDPAVSAGPSAGGHATAERATESRDEADEAIDAAFGFDGPGDGDGDIGETLMSGPPRPAGAPAAGVQAATDTADRDTDIDFVESLLMEEPAFGEGPTFGEEPAAAVVGESRPAPEASSAAFDDRSFGSEFDDIEDEEEAGIDGMASGESDESDLIDLNAFRGLTKYEAPSPSVGDVSSLTLHPMFFEQDPSEEEAEEQEESRQDQWSSSGGG